MKKQSSSCSLVLLASTDQLITRATIKIKDPTSRKEYCSHIEALISLLRRAADNADLTNEQQAAASEGFASFIYNISKSSPNTLRQMKHAFCRYLDWCENNSQFALPGHKYQIVQYLEYLDIDLGLAPTTISSHLAFVALLLRSAELVDETKTKIVQDAMASIRVNAIRNGFIEKQESPFRRHHLEELKLHWENSNTIRDQRDLALLSIAWDSLLRESELARLTLSMLTPHRTSGGYNGTLPYSKTTAKKRASTGDQFYISKESYERLLKVIELTGGDPKDKYAYVFFPLTRRGIKNQRYCDENGRPLKPIRGEAVDEIFDRAYQTLLPDDIHKPWRGHSARIGRAQDLSDEQATNKQLMMLGRWEDPKMPARYTRAQELGDIASKFS